MAWGEGIPVGGAIGGGWGVAVAIRLHSSPIPRPRSPNSGCHNMFGFAIARQQSSGCWGQMSLCPVINSRGSKSPAGLFQCRLGLCCHSCKFSES